MTIVHKRYTPALDVVDDFLLEVADSLQRLLPPEHNALNIVTERRTFIDGYRVYELLDKSQIASIVYMQIEDLL